ncbi:GreA/GreB family elongation factor [Candidatus Dojkabacteria bacterium]|nr:GreA/GreB family elongation factor [Candidatus Dojkabacteria bacterium]
MKEEQSVHLYSKVTIQCDHKKRTLRIVRPGEVDTTENKISQNSPVGKALMNKRVEDTVSVQTLGGAVDYVIVSID